MPILYSAIFVGSSTAAEFAAISGNFNQVAKEFLAKGQIGRNDGKFVYNVEGTTFSFLTKNGVTFLCVADAAYGRIMPTAFLDKLAENFTSEIENKIQHQPLLAEGQLNSAWSKRIKSLVEQVTAHPEQFSKLTAVQSKVDAVKVQMTENMGNMLLRGEQLNTLVDKSSNLLEASNQFQTQGKKLRSHMWCQHFKVQLIVGVAVLLLALVIFLVVCFGVAHCFSGGSPKPPPPPFPSPPLPPMPSPFVNASSPSS